MPLQIIRQDITKMKVDAIVNTTNEEMVGYSGVDYAVHNAAGPRLDKECKKKAPLDLGMAIITKGYNLDCRYIIHTSGPVWQGGNCGESEILRSCYVESLKLAVKHRCKSVAVPLVSSGNYGYPKDKVLKFAISVITEFLFEHEMMVYLCVYDRESYEFSKKLFNEINDYLEDGIVLDEITEYSCAEEKETREFKLFPSIVDDETETSSYFDAGSDCDKDGAVGERSFLGKSAPTTSSSDIRFSRRKNDTSENLHDYMKEMDKPFAYKLFDLIDEKGMTDVECYKKANVDKKTFSKIKCNPDKYKPSKQTAVAFAIALGLDIEQTQDLLASAGMTLSNSYTFDKIIRFFILKGEYDIFEINEALFEFDQVLLGV